MAGGLLIGMAPASSAQEQVEVLPCYNAPYTAFGITKKIAQSPDVDPRYHQRWTGTFAGQARDERIGYVPKLQWFVTDRCDGLATNWFAVPTEQGAGHGWIKHSNIHKEDGCYIEAYGKNWRKTRDYCEVTLDKKTYNLANKTTGKSVRCSAKTRLNIPWAVGRTRASGQVMTIGDEDLSIDIGVDEYSNLYHQQGKESARDKLNEQLANSACFDAPKKPGKYKYKVKSGWFQDAHPDLYGTYCNAFRCYTEVTPAQPNRYVKTKFDRTFQVKADTVIPKF